MKYARFFVIIAAVCLLFSGKAYAYTCTITVGSMTFNNYDIYTYESTQMTTTFTSVIYTWCNDGFRHGNIKLSAGNNYDGGNDTRRMRIGSTGEYLKYNLHKSSSYPDIWGDSNATINYAGLVNVALNSSTGSGGGNYFTIYGTVEMYQDVIAGAYTDTIVVTLEYYL